MTKPVEDFISDTTLCWYGHVVRLTEETMGSVREEDMAQICLQATKISFWNLYRAEVQESDRIFGERVSTMDERGHAMKATPTNKRIPRQLQVRFPQLLPNQY